MRRPMLLPALLLTVLALAGCGGGSGSGSGGDSGEAGKGGSTPDPKQLFAGRCGSCHVLKAAGTSGSFGPNLDDLKPSQSEVAGAIKAGPGAMPAGILAGAEAETVAAYVASNAGK